MRTIDAGHAGRVRVAFAATLAAPSTLPLQVADNVQHVSAKEFDALARTLEESSDDAIEWLALEDEMDRGARFYYGPKFSNKPHALSAYADLPIRGLGLKGQHLRGTAIPTDKREAKRARALWK